MDDMLETMYKAPGIGLAAIQIGVPKRVVVMDVSKDPDKKEPMYFVNPEIVSGKKPMQPTKKDVFLYQINLQKLIDQTSVKLNIWTTMERKRNKAEGLLATCIQHEIDHLNGVLFIDYLSKLKKII